MAGASGPGGWLRGCGLAALWGAGFEAALLIATHLSAPIPLLRMGRLVRIGEVAVATALAGLLLGGGAFWLAHRRGRAAGTPARWVAAAGLGFCAWLAVAFLAVDVSPAEIALTVDPILLRLPAIAGAFLLVPIAIGLAAWSADRAAVRGGGALLPGAAALAVAVALALPAVPREQRADLPDIVLFTVDTLRADHLGCYGYEGRTSPNFDELCKQGLVFDNAISTTSTTIPSYTSMLTGLTPRRHHVYSNYQRLERSEPLVTERLRALGYHTAAIIGGGYPGTGGDLERGFETIDQRGIVAQAPHETLSDVLWSLANFALQPVSERLGWGYSPTTVAMRRWLRELPPGVPIFVHVYWNFPHGPYRPPGRQLAAVAEPQGLEAGDAERVRRYDGEIHFTDVQLGRTVAALESVGRRRDAWLIVTADHGEELARWVSHPDGRREKVWEHSRFLYRPSVRVPLLVLPPQGSGIAPRRVATLVSTASMAATLLRIAGEAGSAEQYPPLPLAPGEAYRGSVVSVARTSRFDRVSIRTSDWKLIENRRPEYGVELYRFDDLAEERNVAREHPEVVTGLLAKLHAWEPPEARDTTAPKADLSKGERDLLRDLGYVE